MPANLGGPDRHGSASTYKNYGCRCDECKEAAGGGRKLRRYGLTIEAFASLVAQQEGKCLVCQRSDKRLTVDHNHETGEVRGLLCDRCNGLVGYLESGLVEVALAYLNKNGTGIFGVPGKAREN
jgi:hypothetical protein